MARDKLKNRKNTQDSGMSDDVISGILNTIMTEDEQAPNDGSLLIRPEIEQVAPVQRQPPVTTQVAPPVDEPITTDQLGRTGSEIADRIINGTEGDIEERITPELVDRLRAFRERRLGGTPSNQFQKLDLAERKLAASESGGRIRTKSVKLRDGRIAIQVLNGVNQGKVYGQDGQLIPNAKFDRTDPLKAGEIKKAQTQAGLDLGVTSKIYQKNIETAIPALRARLKGEFATFDSSRKALPLGKLNGFMAKAVMLNMVAKITENRATDEDRRFVLQAPGKIKEILDKADQTKKPDFRVELVGQATALFNKMKRISEDSIKFAVSNEAKALAGDPKSDGYNERLQEALRRLGGVAPTGEISMKEHTYLQDELKVTRAEEKLRKKTEKEEKEKNRSKLRARKKRKGKK